MNQASGLLTPEQNEYLSTLLGTRCQSRASAVVQVYGTESPAHSQWLYWCCGVATFTKDNSRRSFYIQVYDINLGKLEFEQEIYNNFVYNADSPFFHQFESDSAIVGLNFADESEAAYYANSISHFLDKKKRKLENQQETPKNEAYVADAPRLGKLQPTHKKSKRRNKQTSKKLTKMEIGLPENFRHIQHVGLNSSPATLSTDSLLACIIEMSDIKPKELEDPNAKKLFLDYIDSNGGVKKVYDIMKEIKSSPAPTTTKPTQSKVRERKALPALPDSPKPKSSSKPKISKPQSVAVKPSRVVTSKPTTKTSPRAPSPPPPPPPPAPLPTTPTTVPPAPPSFGPPKSKQPELSKPNANVPAPSSTGRDNLLSEIRNPNIRLKRVETTTAENPEPLRGGNDIINSLAKVLGSRERACHGDSDDSGSDSGSTDDDEEWS